MSPIYLHYLNALDVEALALTDDEILAAVEAGLAAQGRRETVIEPRVHLVPDASVPGHFNVLRGSFRAPINLAGVKVISDYVDNYKQGLPSEVGLVAMMINPAFPGAESELAEVEAAGRTIGMQIHGAKAYQFKPLRCHLGRQQAYTGQIRSRPAEALDETAARRLMVAELRLNVLATSICVSPAARGSVSDRRAPPDVCAPNRRHGGERCKRSQHLRLDLA